MTGKANIAMTVTLNCENCGGSHFGSNKCPLLPEEIERNKKAAQEGFWFKRRERLKTEKAVWRSDLERYEDYKIAALQVAAAVAVVGGSQTEGGVES